MRAFGVGQSNSQTVKTHINHLFSKLDLRDRAATVIFAYEHDLVGDQRSTDTQPTEPGRRPPHPDDVHGLPDPLRRSQWWCPTPVDQRRRTTVRRRRFAVSVAAKAGRNTTMTWYTAVRAPAPLRHVLACCYTATRTPLRRLVPDACIDLVSMSDGSLWVCGPERSGWDFELPDGMQAVGVRFRPGAAAAVFGISASQIADRRWRVHDVLGYEAEQRLHAALRQPNRAGAGHEALTAFVAEYVRRMSQRDRQQLRFSDSMLDALAARPCANALQLADSLGTNVRGLLRRSMCSFGYGPSVLARLLRLQRFLAISSTGRCAGRATPLGRLAVDAGYSDQAHLTRECRTISGLTPVQLLRHYAPAFPDMSDPFKTSERFDTSMIT